jgi:drug/metabolite transporter (DMT)-like permease
MPYTRNKECKEKIFMKIKDVGALLLLSAIWGASFLFIRISTPVLGPVVLVELRVSLAGVALLLYSLVTRHDLDLRKRWRHFLVLGVVNAGIPFILISTAELHLTAGLAAILNATSPIFGAVIAAMWIKEEVLTTRKLIGLLLSLVGVGVVVGWSPLPFSVAVAFSVVASLAAAACFGFGTVYTKVYLQGASSLALATCSQLIASLFVFPLAFVVPFQHIPTLTVALAVAALALLGTALAYLIYFRLVKNIGPSKALTVNFLSPVFGVLWGVLLLSEPLTLSTIIGFGIILAGTGLVIRNFSQAISQVEN